MPRLRSRPPASLYVAGPFAQGYIEFYNFLIPLYGLSLGMSAGAIGMLVGGRSLLAVFLAIHVGMLMARFVPLWVTLFYVWTAAGAALHLRRLSRHRHGAVAEGLAGRADLLG